jgi:hypothetical protein
MKKYNHEKVTALLNELEACADRIAKIEQNFGKETKIKKVA